VIATATLTLTSVAYTVRLAVTFTDVRCPDCNRKLMAIPGSPRIERRTVKNDAERSGRGRVVSCRRCSSLVEVIEHVG
jgi:uncharacterized protein with PIN domain